MIHRDLKPSDALVAEVDGRPTPKYIDFGVAKATEFRLTEQSVSDTSSMDIDTRTDVYCAGRDPLRATGRLAADRRERVQVGAILEMLRMVREVDPPRPSTKVSAAEALPNIAASRDIEPEHLKEALRGGLD
jgi:serine/threonine protein kinase